MIYVDRLQVVKSSRETAQVWIFQKGSSPDIWLKFFSFFQIVGFSRDPIPPLLPVASRRLCLFPSD